MGKDVAVDLEPTPRKKKDPQKVIDGSTQCGSSCTLLSVLTLSPSVTCLRRVLFTGNTTDLQQCCLRSPYIHVSEFVSLSVGNQ